MQHSYNDQGSPLPGMLDITEPNYGVQIQVRGDKKVVWVHVDGATVLRICRISALEVEMMGDSTNSPAGKIYTRAQCEHCDRWGSIHIGDALDLAFHKLARQVELLQAGDSDLGGESG